MIPFARLSAAALVCLLAAAGSAGAMSTIVVDVATGKVLSQDEASERRYPASTTKLMTAYLAFRAIEAGDAAFDTPVVMTREAAAEAPSKMWYEPGSVMRLDNAIRMIMVKSANDVATAIGQTLAGGSQARFVEMMNREAERIGMDDTRFINANGLPGPGQRSSAKDLAILGMTIRRDFPLFTDYFSSEAISTGDEIMRNGNDLIGQFAGADGMKTGYICAAGFSVVASATRDGRTLVAAVLGAPSAITRAREAALILEEGFRTDPDTVEVTIDDLPTSTGEPLDISQEICSPAAQTARANERELEDKRELAFGSPYMTRLERPRAAVPVGLGGAAGTDAIEAGISVIAAFNIPLPTPRPARPGDVASAEPGTGPLRSGTAALPESADEGADAQ